MSPCNFIVVLVLMGTLPTVDGDDDLLSTTITKELCKEGDQRKVELLDLVSNLGDLYATKSDVEVATICSDSEDLLKSTHFFLRDRKGNRWKSLEVGECSSGPIERQYYFDGTKNWLSDDGLLKGFGSSGWQPTKDVSGAFDPVSVWLSEPMYLAISIENGLTKVLSDLECVAARQVGEELECLYSRKSGERRLNRIVQLRFPKNSCRPHKFKIFPSIMGVFSVEAARQVSKLMKLEGELSWTALDEQKDIWVIKEIRSKYHDARCDSELKIVNHWLRENEIPKLHLSDPRAPRNPQLDSLPFR